jgi:acetate kinase
MRVLVLNSGSSSIKFELYRMPEETVEVKGLLQRIGEPESELGFRAGERAFTVKQRVADHAEGLTLILAELVAKDRGGLSDITEIAAVGHRVVHGGESFATTALITDEVVAALEEHAQLAPLHNPPNLLGIRVAKRVLPDVPQVAVFDTAYHQTMPKHAYLYALPYDLYERWGVRRYGFHGTSHRYVAERAAALLGRPYEDTNVITCHLGNGASMAAVRGGRSVDTTMGLTPLEGLVMGTRAGDMDPAIIPYLERVAGMGVSEQDALLNKKSGLLGLSGISNDVRTLLEAEAAGDERAKLALDVYAYRIRKYVGAYTAVLGTVHAVVFTAGVGENSAVIRERVMSGMAPLGYDLDEAKNAQSRGREEDIATKASRSRILVIPTREELVIARDTYTFATSG